WLGDSFLFGGEQGDMKRAPLPQYRCRPYFAAMSPDDRVACSQPQAAPLLFCGEVGVENPLQMVLGNSGAGISYGDFHESLFFLRRYGIFRAYGYTPSFRHGLDRIKHKILDNLAKLSFVRLNRPEVVGKGKFAPDIGTV